MIFTFNQKLLPGDLPVGFPTRTIQNLAALFSQLGNGLKNGLTQADNMNAAWLTNVEAKHNTSVQFVNPLRNNTVPKAIGIYSNVYAVAGQPVWTMTGNSISMVVLYSAGGSTSDTPTIHVIGG